MLSYSNIFYYMYTLLKFTFIIKTYIVQLIDPIVSMTLCSLLYFKV